MSFVVAYALAGAGTLLVVLWVMLYLRYSSQYDVMIAAIDKKQFFLPEIFFIGFGFMDMFKVNLKTEAGRKKEKKIAEIYGEKYAEYYHNCIVGGQITYALTVAPLGLFIGAILSQNIQKGGSELTMSLRYMNEESWEEKKQRAKRKGETAGTKLMIPLMIMFVGILFMIIVPIFSNML